MTINHEKKLIFIHIPKNAGTSIIKAMGFENICTGVENLYMDKSIEKYKEHYQDYWNDYTKFTSIREPIDRFISAYKFARMKDQIILDSSCTRTGLYLGYRFHKLFFESSIVALQLPCCPS